MSWSEPSTLVNSPIQADLLLKQAIENRRQAYAEWLRIRDTLTVDQNAHYMDCFMVLKQQIEQLRDKLRGCEALILAHYN